MLCITSGCLWLMLSLYCSLVSPWEFSRGVIEPTDDVLVLQAQGGRLGARDFSKAFLLSIWWRVGVCLDLLCQQHLSHLHHYWSGTGSRLSKWAWSKAVHLALGGIWNTTHTQPQCRFENKLCFFGQCGSWRGLGLAKLYLQGSRQK